MQKYYYQRLRDIREDREKTQKEIAEVLNTTYQYTAHTSAVCGTYRVTI